MNDQLAQQLLANVMGWKGAADGAFVDQTTQQLQMLAGYKYDHYQRFGPGQRFMESLALWLLQFDASHRHVALDFVLNRLIYIAEGEFLHLVQTAYPDVIIPERIALVGDELAIPRHKISEIAASKRYEELGLKSLYLGLSDGSRTSELRRASHGEINNEQIWQAYELGPAKGDELLRKLGGSLTASGFPGDGQHFTLIWLVDDFSGSGSTYIRYQNGQFAGKLTRAFASLTENRLVDPSHYEVYLLLYVATRQAIDHIEYWGERFTSARGYKPVQIRAIQIIENALRVTEASDPALIELVEHPSYYDPKAHTGHTAVGGTANVRRGFAGCALPVVLAHNSPNNSIYLLWGEDTSSIFKGLFPRVSRHKDV